MIVVLSGGVGAARLLVALRPVTDPSATVAIVNVGDDLRMHGLMICPDIDTITYTLAGINNDELGWGLHNESWRVMDELSDLGGEAWFRLGDRDLATHLYRSQRLQDGATKADVTRELTERHRVRETLVPVTNDPLSTRFPTTEGTLSFQEYFVKRRHNVEVTDVIFEGAETCEPAPGVLAALASAERIVIAPSNPLISIGPILAVPGVRAALAARRRDVVAVSPIIEGHAIKGPAERLLRELGHDATSLGVARMYHDVAATFVIDERDAALSGPIEDLGVKARVTTTIMANPAHARALAEEVLR